MAFTSVCRTDAVSEGGMGLFKVGKKAVLVVWPEGGELKAYRGRCPHADMPLDNITYNGRSITCLHHQWVFDCSTAKCTSHLVRNELHPYPLRVEGDEIQVDVGPVRERGSKAGAQ